MIDYLTLSAEDNARVSEDVFSEQTVGRQTLGLKKNTYVHIDGQYGLIRDIISPPDGSKSTSLYVHGF